MELGGMTIALSTLGRIIAWSAGIASFFFAICFTSMAWSLFWLGYLLLLLLAPIVLLPFLLILLLLLGDWKIFPGLISWLWALPRPSLIELHETAEEMTLGSVERKVGWP